MKYCNHCGTGLADYAVVCTSCGAQLGGQRNNAVQQPVYQAPPQYIVPEYSSVTDKDVMTTGDFLVSYLLLMIPIVQFIMPFVWAFGDSGKSKKSFGKAILILWLISIGLCLLGVFICMAAGIGLGALFASTSY